MNRPLGWALLAVGVVLLIFGAQASDSISSGFSRLFTGAPTDKTIWLLIGGALCVTLGAISLARGRA